MSISGLSKSRLSEGATVVLGAGRSVHFHWPALSTCTGASLRGSANKNANVQARAHASTFAKHSHKSPDKAGGKKKKGERKQPISLPRWQDRHSAFGGKIRQQSKGSWRAGHDNPQQLPAQTDCCLDYPPKSTALVQWLRFMEQVLFNWHLSQQMRFTFGDSWVSSIWNRCIVSDLQDWQPRRQNTTEWNWRNRVKGIKYSTQNGIYSPIIHCQLEFYLPKYLRAVRAEIRLYYYRHTAEV